MLLFPLGVALAWGGVLHWLLYAVGATAEFRSVFHATAQIQGFMTCMAFGFLLTFVPRRTGTRPPAPWELGMAAAMPVAAALAAWGGRWAAAQAFWGAGALTVAAFVWRRVLPAAGAARVPGVFVWVPIALLAGAAGAALVAVAAAAGPHEEPELWQLGRGWLLQGFVTALVVGVGGTMLPTLTRGTPAPAASDRAGAARLAHAAAAAAFLASFPLEVYANARAGLALRAAIAGGVLVSAARLWRPPAMPGLHRRLLWISAWLLPAGFALAAAFPDLRSAALHVTFVGSFALMALSVSIHVALSHGGRPGRLAGRPWQAWALGALLLAAAAFRVVAGADPARLRGWIGLASACFLAATLAWGSLVAPAIRAVAAPPAGLD